MKNYLFQLIVALLTFTFFPQNGMCQSADFHVIPLPKDIKYTQAGNFVITNKTLICFPQGDKELKRCADFLANYINASTGMRLMVSNLPAQRNCIKLNRSLHSVHTDAYNIRVNSEMLFINGSSAAGAFYAIQTLRKALPIGTAKEVIVPSCNVEDYPRFAYRGAHLDVARHFMSADSVKRFIDMLALHNINRFHWHLTDDQGWRIEIKKYPLLTKVGSRRDQTVIGHNTSKYDGTPYGGFYTQKEIKDIVKYAAERYITIIPEIDMPGHMQAALAAYPELGCTGGPYKVWQMWGVSDDVLCAGNNRTLKFIDDVLDEVVRLFPSKYIHVGGDECPKTRWKNCAKCQARIKAEHLEADKQHTAEERLQSYIIKHAEAHLNKLGRQMIGWDETLEGGLAPNATVMSWRGEGGGIEAARQKHNVIMTPNTYLYFDYYQSADKAREPEAIGGYLPIEHVYNYEPVPRQLSADEAKYIIGVQANLWTEYIPTFRQVEYMELPRMAALSEVQWCNLEQKNFKDFLNRIPQLIDVYHQQNYNFAKVIYNVKLQLATDTTSHTIRATLSTFDNAQIRYTLDGTMPTEQSPIYTSPISINKPCTLRAAAFRSWGVTPDVSETFHFNKATACPIRLLQRPHPQQVYGGETLLVDGLEAEDTNFASGRWIGFCGNDLESIIDLGSVQTICKIAIHTCVEKGYWIFDAREFVAEGSTDGIHYTPLAAEQYPALTEDNPNKIYQHTLNFNAAQVRYIKVKVVSEHHLPAWHPGKGNPGFVFVDEIAVE